MSLHVLCVCAYACVRLCARPRMRACACVRLRLCVSASTPSSGIPFAAKYELIAIVIPSAAVDEVRYRLGLTQHIFLPLSLYIYIDANSSILLYI